MPTFQPKQKDRLEQAHAHQEDLYDRMIREENELRNDLDERIGALTREINNMISELDETPYVYQGPDNLELKASFLIYHVNCHFWIVRK